MIKVKTKNNFVNTTKYFEKIGKIRKINLNKIEKYAQEGLNALIENTPKKTGLTANSWYYEITNDNGLLKISFCNSNIQNGWAPIAILLQYGHATNNGGWVEGIDYINPSIQPIFEKIKNDSWKEVIKK